MINLLKKTNKNYIFVEIQNFKIMRRKAFVYNKIMYPDFFNNFKEIFQKLSLNNLSSINKRMKKFFC